MVGTCCREKGVSDPATVHRSSFMDDVDAILNPQESGLQLSLKAITTQNGQIARATPALFLCSPSISHPIRVREKFAGVVIIF